MIMCRSVEWLCRVNYSITPFRSDGSDADNTSSSSFKSEKEPTSEKKLKIDTGTVEETSQVSATSSDGKSINNTLQWWVPVPIYIL